MLMGHDVIPGERFCSVKYAFPNRYEAYIIQIQHCELTEFEDGKLHMTNNIVDGSDREGNSESIGNMSTIIAPSMFCHSSGTHMCYMVWYT